MNGIDFATLIRQSDKNIRIIVSTAYTNPEFTLKAIELDLCRYLVKPLTNEELISAFSKAVSKLDKSSTIKLANNCYYNKKTNSVIKEDKTILLRKKEAEILEFFIEHEGEVLRYDMIENGIWSEQVMSKDAIRSQIRNIRKKIEIDCIKNIVGVGYIFKAKV